MINIQNYRFVVYVDHGYKITKHFTNTIMSKNDGALVKFTDEAGEVHDENPVSCTIVINKLDIDN